MWWSGLEKVFLIDAEYAKRMAARVVKGQDLSRHILLRPDPRRVAVSGLPVTCPESRHVRSDAGFALQRLLNEQYLRLYSRIVND